MNPNQTPQPGETARQRRAQLEAEWKSQQLERSQVNAEKPAEPLVWQELAVQEVHHDYLDCKLVANGVTHGVNIKVAKPPEIRKSIYEGRTIDGLLYEYTDTQARTVTKPSVFGNADEVSQQIIIPKYLVPGDEDASQRPEGKLAFTGSIISAAQIPTYVEADNGSTLLCQLREMSSRAYCVDEEAS